MSSALVPAAGNRFAQLRMGTIVRHAPDKGVESIDFLRIVPGGKRVCIGT